MTVRRLIVALGAVIVVIGVTGLLLPVSVPDGNGGSISCGNALNTDLAAAWSANNRNLATMPIVDQLIPHTDYVTQCESSVSTRRAWTLPLAVFGAIAVVGGWLDRRSEQAPAPSPTERTPSDPSRKLG